MFKKCQSYSDQSECVASLADRATALDKALPYEDHDARRVMFGNMVGVARGGQLVLNLLDSWSRPDDNARHIIPQLLGITPVTEAAVNAAGSMLEKNSKLALVVLGQFQIENLLRILCHELHLPLDQSGFYRLAEAFLDRVQQGGDLPVLNTPALIRNSLHRNGVHVGYQGGNTTTNVGGVSYEFIHEERVQCASWEHIAHGLECSLEVVGRAVQHPDIRALSHPIMEHYAWDILTKPEDE